MLSSAFPFLAADFVYRVIFHSFISSDEWPLPDRVVQ